VGADRGVRVAKRPPPGATIGADARASIRSSEGGAGGAGTHSRPGERHESSSKQRHASHAAAISEDQWCRVAAGLGITVVGVCWRPRASAARDSIAYGRRNDGAVVFRHRSPG
jgi:hypothetical protein